MQIPKGLEIDDGNTYDHVLELHRNVYGQKQAGKVWNDYLSEILINKVGFVQLKVDKCEFYRGKVMYVLYTDDSILAGPDEDEYKDHHCRVCSKFVQNQTRPPLVWPPVRLSNLIPCPVRFAWPPVRPSNLMPCSMPRPIYHLYYAIYISSSIIMSSSLGMFKVRTK